MDGFGGMNCHVVGCGGTLTSQNTSQLITVPDVTGITWGCIWIIDSPAYSAINIKVDEISYENCHDFTLEIWKGLLVSNIYPVKISVQYCNPLKWRIE